MGWQVHRLAGVGSMYAPPQVVIPGLIRDPFLNRRSPMDPGNGNVAFDAWTPEGDGFACP